MTKQQSLQTLFEALKASDAARYIGGSVSEERLSVGNPMAPEDNDVVIHITVDHTDPEKYAYRALSNAGFRNTEMYLELEEKQGVSKTEMIKVVRQGCYDTSPQYLHVLSIVAQ